MRWGDSRHLVRELSSSALDKAAQHFVEFRRLLSVGKMTRTIEDVHPRVRRAAADEVEERVALIDGRRGIVVSPREQRGFAEAPITDDAESFVFLPGQVRQKTSRSQSGFLHLFYRRLVFRQRRNAHHDVQPLFGDMLESKRVLLQNPSLAFPT